MSGSECQGAGSGGLFTTTQNGNAGGRRLAERVTRLPPTRSVKQTAIAGKKIERPIRERELSFKEFAENALVFSGKHKASGNDDPTKIAILVAEFGDRAAASLTQQELAKFLESRGGSPATFNRYRATLSMIYREAIRMGWTERNPARLIEAKKENNARIRFLSDDEENRLRDVIKTMKQSEQYLDEFEIALHTGMRKSEQFSLDWKQVDLKERRLNLLKTKNGEIRMIPLNSTAVAAFERQKVISRGSPKVFITGAGKPFGPDALRHWFADAINEAEVEDFTWREGFTSIDKSLESKEIRNRISKIPPKVPPSRIDWGLSPH